MVNVNIKTNVSTVELEYKEDENNKLLFFHYQNGWFLKFFDIDNEGYYVDCDDYVKMSTNRKVKNKSKLNERINNIIKEGNEYFNNIIDFGLIEEQY